MLSNILRRFIATEAASGLLLMIAACAAMIAANSPLQEYYNGIFSHTVLFWINDGLMVLFFLLIGMEIKRELVDGELSTVSQAALPVVAAIGGMLCPALMYVGINWWNHETLHGWAIASATDIAFSLCILSLLGSRLPTSLKVFLTAVAVIDDLGAIIIIAMFYTAHLMLFWLLAAFVITGVLYKMNRQNTAPLWVYLILGLALWGAVMMSGVHATIAGVLLGLLIPLKQGRRGGSLLLTLEHKLHPYVSYFILPLFAFANAGIHFADLSWMDFTKPVTFGVMAGLYAGKQVGIVLFTGIMIALGLARKPEGSTWVQMYGVAIIAGIGFTMSLFIGGLAFGESVHFAEAKLGVLAGSLLSAVMGYLMLRVGIAKPRR